MTVLKPENKNATTRNRLRNVPRTMVDLHSRASSAPSLRFPVLAAAGAAEERRRKRIPEPWVIARNFCAGRIDGSRKNSRLLGYAPPANPLAGFRSPPLHQLVKTWEVCFRFGLLGDQRLASEQRAKAFSAAAACFACSGECLATSRYNFADSPYAEQERFASASFS